MDDARPLRVAFYRNFSQIPFYEPIPVRLEGISTSHRLLWETRPPELCDCDTSIASPGRFLPSSGTLLCLYSVQRKHLVGQPLRSPSRLLPDRVDEGTHLTVFVWVLHHPENLVRFPRTFPISAASRSGSIRDASQFVSLTTRRRVGWLVQRIYVVCPRLITL